MKILVTGGTGLVGKRLTSLLRNEGHEVLILTRGKSKKEEGLYHWNLTTGEIDPEALKNIDVLVHLAGAGIVDKKWTEARKQEIIDSRVQPLQILSRAFKKQKSSPSVVVSASAIGLYGFDTGDTLLAENAAQGKDYISEIVRKWESAVDDFQQKMVCRAVKIRIGIVLALEGGALPQMAFPVKMLLGSPLGNGSQWLSWIHIDDLCEIFRQSITNGTYDGAYNAVAPKPVTNASLMKTIAEVLKKPFFFPNVPAFIIKMMMGKRAQLVLGGNRVSVDKLLKNGFVFRFTNLKEALQDLYKEV